MLRVTSAHQIFLTRSRTRSIWLINLVRRIAAAGTTRSWNLPNVQKVVFNLSPFGSNHADWLEDVMKFSCWDLCKTCLLFCSALPSVVFIEQRFQFLIANKLLNLYCCKQTNKQTHCLTLSLSLTHTHTHTDGLLWNICVLLRVWMDVYFIVPKGFLLTLMLHNTLSLIQIHK